MPSREQQKRSAANIFAAFEYQWNYFVLMLLKEIDGSNEVNFEVLDDVDVQNGETTKFIQIKHTVQRNASGEIVNLSNRDTDLWKTISVWMKFIDERPELLKSSTFELVTNKNIVENSFIKIIETYKKDRNVNNLNASLNSIKEQERPRSNTDESHDSAMKNTIDVSNIITELSNKNYLTTFCLRISVSKTSDELKKEIKQLIINRFGLDSTRIDLVYGPLMTTLRDDAISKIINHKQVSYTGAIFAERFHALLEIGRKKLKFRTDYTIHDFAGNPRELLFMKQLFYIGDTKEDDIDRITKLTLNWLCFNNNLHNHWTNNDLVRDDINNLTENILNDWHMYQHKFHRKLTKDATSEELSEAACQTIEAMREIRYSLADTPLESVLSEGSLYYYSNSSTNIIPELPLIGWHRDWTTIFKKQ